jgi:hypothetical protein
MPPNIGSWIANRPDDETEFLLLARAVPTSAFTPATYRAPMQRLAYGRPVDLANARTRFSKLGSLAATMRTRRLALFTGTKGDQIPRIFPTP